MLHEILDKWQIKQNSCLAFGAKGELDLPATEFTVVNTSTEKNIFTARYASVQANEKIVAEARENCQIWQQVPAPIRGLLVKKLGDLLETHKHDLAFIMTQEIGKTYKESLGEIREAIDMAQFAVGQSRMLYGLTMQSERPNHSMYEQWHPVGIVSVITAFNFPVAVWAWNAMLAVIAGNVVLWKPSPLAPMTSIFVQKLCYLAMEAQNVKGVFSISLIENKEVIEHVAKNRAIPVVSFTGSTDVGRKISVAVAERFGRSILELSGNNASIVCKSADLSLAAKSILFAATGTAGQRCTSLRRLFVHKDIICDLKQKLVDLYKNLKVGDPFLDEVLIGPLISQASVNDFLQTINAAKELGGEVIAGGQVIDIDGYFVNPAIITAAYDWPILQREAFVPILYIMPFDDLETAIRHHNHSKHGLSSSIFSNDIREVELFLSSRGSDCGIANVNMGPSGAEIGGAFGGEKDTGGGREAGSDAWKFYMRRQTCTKNWDNNLMLAQGIDYG